MRWAIDFGDRDWHRWFAWFPVRVGDDKVWWDYVERRTYNAHGYRIHTYRLTPMLDAVDPVDRRGQEGSTRD